MAKITLYNSRNLRKATSSSYRLVQTLEASSARGVVGVIRASPSRSEVSSLAHYFLKRTVIATCTLLSAAVFLIPQTTGPEVPWISLKSLPPAFLSTRNSPGEEDLIQKWDCRRSPNWTLDLLGGGKHHTHYPKRMIKQTFKTVEEPSFPNQRYQENKIIYPSAFISTELCRWQSAHREIFSSCFCRPCHAERKLTLLRFYCSETGRTAKPNLKHSFVLSEPCCKPVH